MIVQGWPYMTTTELMAYVIVMGTIFLFAILHELVLHLQYRRRKRRSDDSFFGKKEPKKRYTKGGPPCRQ